MDETTEPITTAESAAPDVSAKDEVHTVGVTKSKTHGRIRMRLDKDHRSPEQMAQLKAQLEQDERVSEVVINERTGSVTVKHHPAHDGHDILHKALKEAEFLGDLALDLPEEEDEGEEGGKGLTGYARLDQQLADLMFKVDRSIYRATGGRIRPRGRVFPAAIAGLGVAQIAIYGISLEMLPGPLLLWIAHDIHVRFSKEMYNGDQETSTTESSASAVAAAAPAPA